MNPQLAALFAAHKTAILGGGAAAVAALALYKRKKAASSGTPTTAGVGVGLPAGAVPAAAIVGANGTAGSGYDSSVYDLYNALQPEFDALRQTQGGTSQTGTSTSVAPAPVASTLFSPVGSGNYGLYSNGNVVEIESDGSQLGLSQPQWNALMGQGAHITQNLPGAVSASTPYYETAGNLAGVKKPASTP